MLPLLNPPEALLSLKEMDRNIRSPSNLPLLLLYPTSIAALFLEELKWNKRAASFGFVSKNWRYFYSELFRAHQAYRRVLAQVAAVEQRSKVAYSMFYANFLEALYGE